MNEPSVRIGLYRHFKGDYFYVTGITKASEDYSYRVTYFNVCRPELGQYSRPMWDFLAENSAYEKDDTGVLFPVGEPIKDREDNITGQNCRFERVKDLNFQLGSVSTEQLFGELLTREDSPIRDFDLEGAESTVFLRDYVCGVPVHDEVHGDYLQSWVQFDEREEAVKYAKSKSLPGRVMNVFKRILLKESM